MKRKTRNTMIFGGLMALVMAAGTAVGGWWGARAVVKGGEKVIRVVLVAAILIMALKILGAF